MIRTAQIAIWSIGALTSSCSGGGLKTDSNLSKCWPDIKVGAVSKIEAVFWQRGGAVAISPKCPKELARISYETVDESEKVYKTLKNFIRKQHSDLQAFRITSHVSAEKDGKGVKFIIRDISSIDMLKDEDGKRLIYNFTKFVAEKEKSRK